MPDIDIMVTEADILSQLVAPNQPGLSEESARAILQLRFNQAALDRMRELAAKNAEGTLTEAERSLMEKYLRVGQFLDLIQAKARISLNNAG